MTSHFGAAALSASWSVFLTLTLLLLLETPLALSHSEPDAFAGAPLRYRQPRDCPMQRSLRVRINGAGADARKIVTLHLIESSEDFLHRSERSGSGRVVPPCFYQGTVQGAEGLVVAQQRDGLISGSFQYGSRVYEIPEQPAQSAAPLTAHPMPPSSHQRSCGLSTKEAAAASAKVDADAALRHQADHERHRRALKLDTYSTYAEASRKYIQLILIGDRSFYLNQSSNMATATDRLWLVANYVNALYKQLGVNVITVYTEVWTTDPYTLTSATNPAGANSSEMLDLFMLYRMRSLGSKTHTAAHLISALKFAGSGDVGLAHLGKLCSFSQGGGVNSDREANAYGIAATVAHELGHNLGLNHDEDERPTGCGTCPDSQGCIMATVGTEVNPIRWSNCSIVRYLDYSVSNGLGYCMSDPPLDSATVSTKATCGNRIVEAGEDCDCGPPTWCNNTCCNPSTCRFNSGATCASGECCNRNTCTMMTQGIECRAARGTCDLPEYCNGSSEWCPQFDDYKVDGTECSSGKAYCYKGRCNDRDSRCAAIFNGTGYSAADASWSVANTQGQVHGYCSYNETNLNPLTYTYTACTAANQRCGLLHCVSSGLTISTSPSSRWKGLDSADTRVYDGTVSGVAITSAGYAKHNLKYSGYRDPGMVPNGAECGTNMMCVDSVCVSTASSVTCPSCNSRGFCAQSGLCFCQTGYRPPDCLQTGGGGSLTNRLPDTDTTTPSTTSTTKSASHLAAATSWWLLTAAQLQLLLIGLIASFQ